MITCIIGLTGSGKTWFLSQLLYKRWLAGENIISYNQLYFSDENERINRFWQLSDLYTATNAVIGFPELQKLLNAGAWRSLPPMFMDLICQHRHSQLDIIGDTQELMQIDCQLRRNIHEVYVCQTILRIPKTDKILPWLHWIRIQKKIRKFDAATDRVVFVKEGRAKFYFISRLWTKKLYDTFEKSNLSKYLIWAERKQQKWKVIMANRQLIASGKFRR